jgi:hypothetical protein
MLLGNAPTLRSRQGKQKCRYYERQRHTDRNVYATGLFCGWRGIWNFCGLPSNYLPLSVAAKEGAGVAIVCDSRRLAGAVLFVGDEAEGDDGEIGIFVDGDVLGGIFCGGFEARAASAARGNAAHDFRFGGDGSGGVGVDDVICEEAIEAGDVVARGILQKLSEHVG